MLLNCGVGEDSWESLGLQGNQTSQLKGNQYWIFIGRTDAEAESPVLWPPDAKTWLIGKYPDAGNDGRQEEKGMTEDKMVGWHHWLNEHEFEQAPGVSDGQGSLACCSPWGCKESNMTEWLNWTDIYIVQTLRGTKGYTWYVVSLLLVLKISLFFLVNNCLFLPVPCKSLQKLLAQGVYICMYGCLCMYACMCVHICVYSSTCLYILYSHSD